MSRAIQTIFLLTQIVTKNFVFNLGLFAASARSTWLPGGEVEAMLAEDIQALRHRLNIPEPIAYHRLLATLRAKSEWQAGLSFAQPTAPDAAA